jgi:hypothetical protein
MLIKDQCTYRAHPTGTARNRPKINTMPIVIAGFNVLAGAGCSAASDRAEDAVGQIATHARL